MAEVIAVISFVSAVAGLFDTSAKFISRLNEFHSAAHVNPETFRHISAQLPIVIDGLRRTEERARAGDVDWKTQEALVPTLEGCRERVGCLLAILEDLLPRKSDSSMDRAIKAARSLGKDKKVQKLLKDIDGYLLSLTFHNTSGGPPLVDRPLPIKLVNMVPTSRDPNFVDRPGLFAEIASTIGQYGRAALAGIGGAGKTQLAIEQCYRSLKHNPSSHIFWVHAGSVSKITQSVQIIAEQLQLPGWNDPQVDKFRVVHGWLSDVEKGHWLLVVDNADDLEILEQLLPSETGPKTLLQLFPRKKNGAILVTTRDRRIGERLAVRGKTITVSTMSCVEGRQLLTSFLDRSFDYNLGEIDLLVRTLDYLPLAITQAAAYMTENFMSLQDYLSLLRESDDEMQTLLNQSLSDDRREDPESNSVIKTWKLSFDQIRKQDACAADMLSLMAMFDRQGVPADFLSRRKESRRVLASSLATLRNFSLIVRTMDGEAYRMHRLVQMAVQAWLKIQGTLATWEENALFVLADVFPSGEYTTWPLCEAYMPHARVVLQAKLASDESRIKRAELLKRTAWFDRRQDRFQVAMAQAREAAELFGNIRGPENSEVLSCMVTVADCMIELWQPQEAKEILRANTAVMERVLGLRHSETLRSMGNQAWACCRCGNFEEAAHQLHRTMKLREEVLGTTHPDTLLSMNNLAVNACKLDKSWQERAEELFRIVLALQRDVFPVDHPDILDTQGSLASCLDGLGKHSVAEALFRRTIASRERIYDMGPTTLTLMSNLGVCLYNQDKLEEALTLDKAILALRERLLGTEHIDTILTRVNLAAILLCLGYKDEAAEQSRLVLACRETIARSQHPQAIELVTSSEESLQRSESANETRREVDPIPDLMVAERKEGNIIIPRNFRPSVKGSS